MNLAALGLARQPRGHAGAERGPGADPFAVGDHGQHPAAERPRLFMEWLLGSEDTERISVEEFSVPLRSMPSPRPACSA